MNIGIQEQLSYDLVVLKVKFMDRYGFIALDRNQQIRLLKLHGRIIHRKVRKNYNTYLFELENFYIELWENSIGNSIVNLVVFKDKTLLRYSFNMLKKSEINP